MTHLPSPGIQPATLAFDARGTPRSETYDDVYHAGAGGIAQVERVFLAGNGLPGRWQDRPSFTILETGFGQGLNFLATWRMWRKEPGACRRLFFVSVEKHPFTRDDLATLHAGYPELGELAARLRQSWPPLTAGVHRLEFEEGQGASRRQIVLTLALGDAASLLPRLVAQPDAIFLDGFAPAKNPDLWSPALLSEIGLLAKAGTTVATWSVATPVREALARAGFHCEKRPGFGGKREMLAGQFAACPGDAGSTDERAGGATPIFLQVVDEAVVVGAGLAGALIAEALARRGVQVRLFERQPAPAMETSGNLTAVMLPMLSLDDNRASRLNRACYLHALSTVAEWRRDGYEIDGTACGVLQVARDAAHDEKQREILARCGFPRDYVRQVEADEASRLAGVPVAGAGWWFPGGAWFNPPSLCRAALARAGGRLTTSFGTGVERIEPLEGEAGRRWSLFDAQGRHLATTACLVLASAHDLLRLPQTAHLPLFRFRGQVTHVPAPPDAPLRAVVCKEGYVSPAWQGLHCVGASFHRGGEAALSDEDHRANLKRLWSMLPGYLAETRFGDLGGRVAFRPVSPDKLPIVGAMYRPDATPQGRDLSAVERWPGLYVATGYGARGLVWSVLMAELLASEVTGEPLPLESDLAATVDPARFLLRRKDG